MYYSVFLRYCQGLGPLYLTNPYSLLKLLYMNQPELLAPAGNLDKLKTAFAFGADAVYCGIPEFSLRVRINQFDFAKLDEGIQYAHSLGKRVYVTVNIFAHNKHLLDLEDYILELKKIQPDALIISDPGILSMVKKIWPNVKIHLSTQANCTNWQSAKFWHEQGISRIVLGREVTLEEIHEIHEKVSEVELECFVHGAMCMSYSGRCLLSKFYNDRSANLGDCTQPCRWKYDVELREEKRPELPLEIEEDQHGSYIMNSKDLCLVDSLEELKEAGVVSFKIEGRAKSAYYLGNTVKVYREIMDNGTLNITQPIEELKKSQNRGFTTGFIFGKDKVEQKTDKCHEECEWEFCGIVTDYLPSLLGSFGKAGGSGTDVRIKVHNQIFVGDQIEFVVPGGENFEIKIEKMYDEDMNEVSEAHGGQGKSIIIPVKKDLPKYTLLRRKVRNL